MLPCAEPLIVPLWPDCEVPLVLPAPVEDVLPDVPAPVPVVEPLPLVVPEVAPALPEALVPPVLPAAPVLPDEPLMLEPDAPEPLIEAWVSIQLLPEPARHPVTVTVFALMLVLDVLCSSDIVVLEPLVPVVPVVPLVPCVPLVDPLCAATLTAKARARPEAVVTTRFMCSILQ
jgi:hypothetical protein